MWVLHTDSEESERREFYFHHIIQAATDESTNSIKSRNILPETTRPCNKRFTTHCKSMRNSEFFKSKNTNSQARCNSEELLAEKAVFPNSHPSSEKTERLERWIGILFQCEDLQSRRIEFLRNFFICFTFSAQNSFGAGRWVPDCSPFSILCSERCRRLVQIVLWLTQPPDRSAYRTRERMPAKTALDKGLKPGLINKKACMCISQKVYLEPKWLRYSEHCLCHCKIVL